ncbi:MAG: hypothetical protein M3Q99_04190 [Acidobacteriota bacterium]|nr:hypothetical protein [Acidobacteriota bacterium]
MIEGFDKEIDALLRQTAKGETAFAETNPDSRFKIPKSKIQNPKSKIHPDADEISAFAENALPEKLKPKYTAHFADCDRCRKILSNTISLNSEAEIVPAFSVAAPNISAIKNIPWYQRIFAFPNAAYAMGALVVLFGGFLAFTLLQNVNNSHRPEVSMVSDSQPKASGPSAESEPDFSANTMSNMSIVSMNSMSNSAMSNSASVNTSNASASTGQKTNANLSAANTNSVKKELPLNEVERATEKDLTQAKPAAPTATDSTAGSVADNQSVTSNQVAELPRNNDKAKIAQAAPSPTAVENLPLNGRTMSELKTTRAKNPDSKAKESRPVSGRNFTRKDGVWYDSAYNGQTTTNISRGSNEYRKLDSGLRSIAENLNGTIVVVWKSNAYRIQ